MSDTLEVPPAGQQRDGQLSANEQFAIVTTLVAYCGIILVGVSHHEPWADEAQAWLLSRDLGYRYLVFRQLAYEGVPPLWPTLLWIANHWFHLPYEAMGWIGGLCAIAGCWFFCRYSPLPLFVRILFPFTYFMAFQYAIVARPYVLLPLCTFVTAHFFADAERRPWRFVAATTALALLCAPGVMIAIGLTTARVWYTSRSWNDIPRQERKKLIGAVIAFGIVLGFVATVNWPPADRSFARFDRPASNTHLGLALHPRDLSVALLGFPIPSILLLVVVAAWCACRRRLLPFVLPAAFVLAFFGEVYANLWHFGALTLILIAALWIAWPLQAKCAPRLAVGLDAFMLIGIACLLAVNIYWTARTLAMDYSRPYSGSLDAANFLRSVGADSKSTCGLGFHSVALQPYFRESIFANWPQGESFWRWEQGNHSNNCSGARWVVFPICCTFGGANQQMTQSQDDLRSFGYVPVHVSRGSMFFEGREVEPTDFIVYRLAK